MLLQLEACLPAAFALELGGRRVQTIGFGVGQDPEANEVECSLSYSFSIEHDPSRLHDATNSIGALELTLEPDDPRWSQERSTLDFDRRFEGLFPIFDSEGELFCAFASYAILLDYGPKALAPYCLWHRDADGTIRRTIVGVMQRPEWEDGCPDVDENGALPAQPPPQPPLPRSQRLSQTVPDPDTLTRERVLMQIEECLPGFFAARARQQMPTVGFCVTRHKDDLVPGVCSYSYHYSANGEDGTDGLPYFDESEMAAFAPYTTRLLDDEPDLSVTCCLWHKEADGSIVATRAPPPSVVMTHTSMPLPTSLVVLIWVVSIACALAMWALRLVLRS